MTRLGQGWARARGWWAAGGTRHRAIRRGVLAGWVLILVGATFPVPFVVLSPGPTFNTIGEHSGQPLIRISGVETFQTKGTLAMTTVSERGGASGGVNTAEVLLGLVAGDRVVVPRDSMYPPDRSGDDVRAANTQSFQTSKYDAIGAALDELGIDAVESVVVAEVVGGSPADGIVRAGDRVRQVNGKPVKGPDDVVAAVRAAGVGATVQLLVERADEGGGTKQERLEVVAGESPDPERSGQAYLGISVGDLHEAPFDVDFSLETVGGPSAGMMFALAIVDKLTEGSLTGGHNVAGTGTIAPDGTVGAIGGIRHKLAGARRDGAELFLAPRDNCAEVVGHVPDGLTVVAVHTLHEARTAVAKWAADPGTKLPSCSD